MNTTLTPHSENIARIISAHNEQSIAIQSYRPDYISKLEFLGEERLALVKNELIPNEHNPALMDVAEVSYYSGKFLLTERPHKNIKRSVIWYQIAQDVKRLEIGSYYDNRD